MRAVVDFTEQPQATEAVDLDAHRNGSTLTSTTRELAWTTGDAEHTGEIVISTGATQAFVGFAHDTSADLPNVLIQPADGFSAIYVTAPEKGGTLADGETALVTAIARARNDSMKIVGDRLLEKGGGGVILEPVKATLTFKRPVKSIEKLDHAGQSTGEMIELNGDVFELDTGRDETPYYLVTFDR